VLATPEKQNKKSKMAAASSGKQSTAAVIQTPVASVASFIKPPCLNETPPIIRNDIPDIFWQSVEPYCADITDDDIRLLENQIELCDKFSTFSKSKRLPHSPTN
jgi:hypothetical protein